MRVLIVWKIRDLEILALTTAFKYKHFLLQFKVSLLEL